MLQVTASFLNLTSRMIGASVVGAQLLPVPQADGSRRIVDSVLAATDRIFNSGNSIGVSPVLSSVRQGVGLLVGARGLQQASDPIMLTASGRTQVALLQAREMTIDQRIVDARSKAAGGDPAARQQLATLLTQKQETHVKVLDMQASSAGQAVRQVQDELMSQFTRSTGWQRYLADGGADPLAEARAARTPEERAAVNDRIMVALGVGVAQLDHLRAQIQYFEYLKQTGQLTPEQQARLDALRDQYAGSSQQVEVLNRARTQFQAENSSQLASLHNAYLKTEQHVSRLVETQERISGRSLDGSAALDWDTATEEQKAAHLHAASDTIRTLNTRAVEHHDVSGFRQLQSWNLAHWSAFQVDMDRRARERADERRADRRDFDRHMRARSDARALEHKRQHVQRVEDAVVAHREDAQRMHEGFLIALDTDRRRTQQLSQPAQ